MKKLQLEDGSEFEVAFPGWILWECCTCKSRHRLTFDKIAGGMKVTVHLVRKARKK